MCLGQFGQVYKGTLIHDDHIIRVAAKTMRESGKYASFQLDNIIIAEYKGRTDVWDAPYITKIIIMFFICS